MYVDRKSLQNLVLFGMYKIISPPQCPTEWNSVYELSQIEKIFLPCRMPAFCVFTLLLHRHKKAVTRSKKPELSV